MKHNYEKEINCVVDPIKKIECVNLSVGANNKEDFSWIANNLELFKKESIENYNRIISSIMLQVQAKLYFIVIEKKETQFSAVEKHLGVWHRFKGVSIDNKSEDFYVNDTLRYSYTRLDNLKLEQISMLCCGELVFLRDDAEIACSLERLLKNRSVFDSFYDKGFILANFRDLWTEGNSLSFYSKDKRYLSKIVHIAQEESFTIK